MATNTDPNKPADAIATVINDAGVPFHVRVVCEGGRYGLDNCLTHDKAEPMVEYYDGRSGQFVSRYYLDTLRERTDKHGRCGLALDCGVASWSLDACAFEQSMRAVEAHLLGVEQYAAAANDNS